MSGTENCQGTRKKSRLWRGGEHSPRMGHPGASGTLPVAKPCRLRGGSTDLVNTSMSLDTLPLDGNSWRPCRQEDRGGWRMTHSRVLSSRGGGEDPRQGHRDSTASEARGNPRRSRVEKKVL